MLASLGLNLRHLCQFLTLAFHNSFFDKEIIKKDISINAKSRAFQKKVHLENILSVVQQLMMSQTNSKLLIIDDYYDDNNDDDYDANITPTKIVLNLHVQINARYENPRYQKICNTVRSFLPIIWRKLMSQYQIPPQATNFTPPGGAAQILCTLLIIPKHVTCGTCIISPPRAPITPVMPLCINKILFRFLDHIRCWAMQNPRLQKSDTCFIMEKCSEASGSACTQLHNKHIIS